MPNLHKFKMAAMYSLLFLAYLCMCFFGAASREGATEALGVRLMVSLLILIHPINFFCASLKIFVWVIDYKPDSPRGCPFCPFIMIIQVS